MSKTTVTLNTENPAPEFWAAINAPGPRGGPEWQQFLFGWTENSSGYLEPDDAAELLAFCEAQPGWRDGPERPLILSTASTTLELLRAALPGLAWTEDRRVRAHRRFKGALLGKKTVTKHAAFSVLVGEDLRQVLTHSIAGDDVYRFADDTDAGALRQINGFVNHALQRARGPTHLVKESWELAANAIESALSMNGAHEGPDNG